MIKKPQKQRLSIVSCKIAYTKLRANEKLHSRGQISFSWSCKTEEDEKEEVAAAAEQRARAYVNFASASAFAIVVQLAVGRMINQSRVVMISIHVSFVVQLSGTCTSILCPCEALISMTCTFKLHPLLQVDTPSETAWSVAFVQFPEQHKLLFYQEIAADFQRLVRYIIKLQESLRQLLRSFALAEPKTVILIELTFSLDRARPAFRPVAGEEFSSFRSRK